MLPIEHAPGLLESLREYGYRPIRLRPFRHGGEMFVAAIWSRDEYGWKAEFGIPGDQFPSRSAMAAEQDLGLDELAAYVEDDQWRFVAVWSEHPDALLESQVSLIEPQTDWQATFDANVAAGWQPHTYQLATGANDDLRRSQIWRRRKSYKPFLQRTNVTADRLSAAGSGYITIDTSTYLGWRDKPFGAVWVDNLYADSKSLVLESPDELQTHWTRQDFDGFRPVAISLASEETRNAPLSVMVWQRQLSSDEAKQRYADIKSNFIAALLSLGETDTTLPFLRHSADPTLRSFLIKKLAAARVSVKVLHACLQDDSLDADVRQALILALGNYARSAVPVEERTRIGQSLQEMYVADADIGVRSAAEWVLRCWGLAVPSSETSDSSAPDHCNWLVTPGGQTMAVLNYPENFQPRGAAKPPTNHRFAIATKELTVKEFARFRPEHPIDYRARDDDTCPAHMMDWYAAAAYCNWLNETEGIRPDQWCYLPNEEGKFAEGMTIAPDFLTRRGYRLPLAAEWLYAAQRQQRRRHTVFGSDDGINVRLRVDGQEFAR